MTEYKMVIGSEEWLEFWSNWYWNRANRAFDAWMKLPTIIKREHEEQQDIWFYLLMGEWWRTREPWA